VPRLQNLRLILGSWLRVHSNNVCFRVAVLYPRNKLTYLYFTAKLLMFFKSSSRVKNIDRLATNQREKEKDSLSSYASQTIIHTVMHFSNLTLFPH